MMQARLWGKRRLAATVMTLTLLLVLVMPLSTAIATIAANGDDIVAWANRLSAATLPSPPEFVAKVSIVAREPRLRGAEYAAKVRTNWPKWCGPTPGASR